MLPRDASPEIREAINLRQLSTACILTTTSSSIGVGDFASLNMADDADSQYNNSNRAFLQAFIARTTLTFEEAKPLFAAIFTAHGKSLDPFYARSDR